MAATRAQGSHLVHATSDIIHTYARTYHCSDPHGNRALARQEIFRTNGHFLARLDPPEPALSKCVEVRSNRLQRHVFLQDIILRPESLFLQKNYACRAPAVAERWSRSRVPAPRNASSPSIFRCGRDAATAVVISPREDTRSADFWLILAHDASCDVQYAEINTF